jgi:hypothetical protein
VQHDDLEPADEPANVVKVVPNAWVEYGLMWPEAETAQTANTVVFANFSKNEN